MCQAIKDIKADSRAEGRAEGVIKTLKAIMSSLHLTAEQAVAAANVPENERKAYIAKLTAEA